MPKIMRYLRVAQRSALLLLLFVFLVALAYFFQKWLLNLQVGLFLDGQSTRYLLSAISQCEAAIIGLVVTVTLIAVQLSVTAYVPRVASIFMRYTDLWLLMLIYGSSITYCLFLLNTNMITWEIHRDLVLVAYSTFPAAFIMLIPYISGTMKALNPRSVMQKLLEEVTFSEIRNTTDKILPVEDLICTSLRKEDFTTAMFGLRALASKIVYIANSYSANQHRHWRVSRHPISAYLNAVLQISKHLERPGRILAGADSQLCSRLVSFLVDAAQSLSKNRLHAEADIMGVLASIGMGAIDSGNRELATKAMKDITKLCGRIPFLSHRTVRADGKTEITRYTMVIERGISALEAIGKLAVKRWNLISAMDYCRCLAHVSTVYSRKRGHRQDRNLSFFPTEEPIMRTVNSLDHCMVDALLELGCGLSSNVGEVELFHYIIEPLVTTARASYEKGYTAIGDLSDFGGTVGAIWDIGGAASLHGTQHLQEEIAIVLAELANLDRQVVNEEMQKTISSHYKLSKLDLSSFQALYRKHLQRNVISRLLDSLQPHNVT